MPERELSKSREITQKLAGVEILYILASKPKTLTELTAQLKTTFGLETVSTAVVENLLDLRSRKFVRSFSSHPILNQPAADNSSHESFSITPLGLSTLSEWIESLSEITLTMQLGLNQRVTIAEE